MNKKAKPRGLFVTGTDTEVGKTEVACAVAHWLYNQGVNVGCMKPIATGGKRLRVRGGSRLIAEDARALARAVESEDPWEWINPICFREPLAPWTAALRANQRINLRSVYRAFDKLRDRHNFLIVEGIGGLLVPVTRYKSVADIVKALGLPVLVVGRASLGTLNHTLLTVHHLREMDLTVDGVVINHLDRRPRDRMARVAQQTNPQILKSFGNIRILGDIPYIEQGKDVEKETTWKRMASHCDQAYLGSLL